MTFRRSLMLPGFLCAFAGDWFLAVQNRPRMAHRRHGPAHHRPGGEPGRKLEKGVGEMIRKGFKMKLHPGMEQEYERRHNLLWPEMKEMIHAYGGRNYSIFLDPDTLVLYGYIELEDEAKWSESANTAICRKWWDFMADIMDVNPDNSPVAVDLHPVFHLD